MRDDPLFQSLLLSRRSRPGAARRLAACGLVASLYFVFATALIVSSLLVVESIDPPRAASDRIPVFHARPPGATGGGAASLPAQPRGGRAAAGPDASPRPPAFRLQPPAAHPVVVPLAPPASEAAADLQDAGGADRAGARDGGGGDGSGDGRGGPACAGCTGDGIGDGPGTGGEEFFDEQDPRIQPPVVILSSRALPKYPELARRAGVQGTVILLVTIGNDGRVGEVEVLRSPDPRYGFDLAAIEAVKQWRYRPALLEGRPVAVQASVLVEFTISRP